LFENDFGNLYEEREKTEIKGISSKEKMKLKKNKNLNNVDNILGINLLNKYDNDKIVSNAFGIPDILRATKYFIKKLNPFKKEDFNKVENYIKEFKKYNSNNKLKEEENKNYLLLKENCKNLIIQISMDNSLLYKLKNKDEIIEKAKNEADKIIYISSVFGFEAGLIPAPFVDIPILYSINLSMILKIGKCFSVEFNEIPNWDRV
jgi:hypothetical protein